MINNYSNDIIPKLKFDDVKNNLSVKGRHPDRFIYLSKSFALSNNRHQEFLVNHKGPKDVFNKYENS